MLVERIRGGDWWVGVGERGLGEVEVIGLGESGGRRGRWSSGSPVEEVETRCRFGTSGVVMGLRVLRFDKVSDVLVESLRSLCACRRNVLDRNQSFLRDQEGNALVNKLEVFLCEVGEKDPVEDEEEEEEE